MFDEAGAALSCDRHSHWLPSDASVLIPNTQGPTLKGLLNFHLSREGLSVEANAG